MILGVGIDNVTISVVDRFLGNPEYTKEIFTVKELELSNKAPNQLDFLAGRFAAKNAAWKALNHVTGKTLDKEKIEILRKEDGTPYVSFNAYLKGALEGTSVKSFVVSITTEGDLATSIVIAQDE
ncbi:MAG: holo-ACP synthase [Erysipelotrichales bacterium]|nr:holo-ACP synthase [Erysipelotrichales bacterium]